MRLSVGVKIESAGERYSMAFLVPQPSGFYFAHTTIVSSLESLKQVKLTLQKRKLLYLSVL